MGNGIVAVVTNRFTDAVLLVPTRKKDTSPVTEQSVTNETFLSARRVMTRYGVSDMWIWRRMNEEGGKFPQPLRINGRRFWRVSDLLAYEASLVTEAA